MPKLWEAQVQAGLVLENDGIRFCQSILIDEAEVIINEALNNYFHADVVACTFSIPYEDIMKKEEDNGGQ
jgi:hypothetical protein